MQSVCNPLAYLVNNASGAGKIKLKSWLSSTPYDLGVGGNKKENPAHFLGTPYVPYLVTLQRPFGI
jgi:hypothetical protein